MGEKEGGGRKTISEVRIIFQYVGWCVIAQKGRAPVVVVMFLSLLYPPLINCEDSEEVEYLPIVMKQRTSFYKKKMQIQNDEVASGILKKPRRRPTYTGDGIGE